MHAALAELARRHALSPELVAELEALLPHGDRPVGPSPADDRYEDLGPVGQGGMGEVRRVRDRVLDRVVAQKRVHGALLEEPLAVARFVDEAKATAQLQHPNIVPVHDLGRGADGRLWFTMKEVRGRTLSDVIAEVHAASTYRWETVPSGWSLRRLVTAFHAVCQAVAFAHEHGVVHRDLKPDNTMVGRHGEVYVLDWGLAKHLGGSRQESVGAPRVGQVAGTPAYMPPEQARGDLERVDARSDVYALGAMLYELLSGRPPFVGEPRVVLAQVLAGPPPPVGRSPADPTFGYEPDDDGTPPDPPLPEELVAACERAMARDPDRRFPTAIALADAVQAWLDGSKRREQALAVVARAEETEAAGAALAARAAALRAEAAALLSGVAGWEPEERKAPGWAKEAEAAAAEQAAELHQLSVDETLKAALQFVADLPEAHLALVQRYRARFDAAEEARDHRAAAAARVLLEQHAAALPEFHLERRAVALHLEGAGALTLVTDPPGAEVLLYRFVEVNRRLVERFERSLGTTPLRAAALPMGSYLCVLRHPDRAEVRYAVEVTRRGHWDGVAPEESAPHPVWLPPPGFLAPDEVYVPAGRFRAGGDPDARGYPAMRPWCDAFVMDRFPVTNARYLEFLGDLVAQGREEEALAHAPRERGGTDDERGALIYGYEGGAFFLRRDADGDEWSPDAPVTHVDWHGARAYLAWKAERTGRPWRLPAVVEWEKAARGVDGRWYPWGNQFDPSWARTGGSLRGRDHGDVGPVAVDRYPVDTSPWGVRGLGGNVQDWCLDLRTAPFAVVGGRVDAPDAAAYAASRANRTVRGGSWLASAALARATSSYAPDPLHRNAFHGFRGLWPLGPAAG